MRMIVPVTDKDPRRQLGELIQRARVAREFTHRDISEQCGVPQTKVKEWEDGVDVPRGNEWARLKGMLYTLRPAGHVWQAALRMLTGSATAAAEERAEEQASAAAPPTPANDQLDQIQVEPPPLQDPRLQSSFGAALRIARLNIGFTQDELGQFIDVTGSTISQWENDSNPPVLDNWNKLVDALPELRECAPPGIRNIQKPGRQFPRAPTNPGASGPQFPRAPTQQPPLQLAPAPEPTPLPPRDNDAIAEAGVTYAYALKAEQRAKERVAAIQKQLAAAENAAKLATADTATALKQLMTTVGIS